MCSPRIGYRRRSLMRSMRKATAPPTTISTHSHPGMGGYENERICIGAIRWSVISCWQLPHKGNPIIIFTPKRRAIRQGYRARVRRTEGTAPPQGAPTIFATAAGKLHSPAPAVKMRDMPNHRYGRILATLVGGALISVGTFSTKAPHGLAIAGSILIGSVLIASRMPGPPPPPRPDKPKPPQLLG